MKRTFDFKPVFHTALALLPPLNKCGQIQKIRQKHDSAFVRWMPHINFLFPFYDAPHFVEVADRLERAFSDISPFLLKFEKFNHFDHSKKAVMWMEPVVQNKSILQTIYDKVIKICPNLQKRDEFHPHCTVGQFSKKELAKRKEEFQKDFQAVEFIVKGMHIVARKGKDTPMEEIKFIPFGSKRFEIDPIPFVDEGELKMEIVKETFVSSTLQVLSKDVVGIDMIIKLKTDEKNVQIKINKRVVLVLDISGSMAGSALRNAKVAIVNLLESTKDKGILYEFITYDSVSQIFKGFSKECTDKQKEIVNGVNTKGCTNFNAAFISVFEVLKESRGEEVQIIFFTDGQDNMSQPFQRKSTIEHGHIELIKARNNFSYHCIGFTSQHDAKLLTEIARKGTTAGTFQYVKESSDIDGAMTNLSGLLGGRSISSYIMIGGKRKEKVFMNHDEGSTFTSQIFLKKSDVEEGLVLFIQDNAQITELKVQPIEKKCESENDIIKLFTSYLEFKLMSSIAEITSDKTSKKRLDEIKSEITNLDKEFDEKIKLMFKIRSRMVKKEFLQKAQIIKQLIGKFFETLRAASTKSLTNDKIAQLNSMAYKNISKAGLKKKLDKRIANNLNMFEKIDKIIDDQIKQYNFIEIRKKYAKSLKQNEYDKCILSCCDWTELLENGDCLCISIDLIRSEAAIADPSRVFIKGIKQTMISAESFLDSVMYSLSTNSQSENVHSGFGFKQGKVLTGIARENITGCLPLFINEEHWKIAKHKIKPLLGWMVTLDPLGYAFSQVLAVPFLVLAKAAESYEKSDFGKKQFKMILDTCIHIYKQFNLWTNKVKPLWQSYSSSPINRTVDKIARNEIFLMQMLCAVQSGDLKLSKEELNNFIMSMIEEEMRRKVPKELAEIPMNQDKSVFREYLYKLLGIDKKIFIKSHIEKYKSNYMKKMNSNWANVFYEFKKSGKAIKKEVKKDVPIIIDKSTLLKDVDKTPIIIEYPMLNDFAKVELKKISEAFTKWIAPFINAAVKLMLPNAPTYKTIEDLKLNNNQLLAMFIQNMEGSKNANRRALIDNKTYMNPFKFPKDFLYKRIESIVNEDKSLLISSFVNEIAGNVLLSKCEVMKKSTNLHEIAGLLVGITNRLGKECRAFLDVLKQKKNVKFPMKKMEILLNGEMEGVKLIVHEEKKIVKSDQKDDKKVVQVKVMEKKSNKIGLFKLDILELFLNNYTPEMDIKKFIKLTQCKDKELLEYFKLFEKLRPVCIAINCNNYAMKVTDRLNGVEKYLNEISSSRTITHKNIMKELLVAKTPSNNPSPLLILCTGETPIDLVKVTNDIKEKETIEMWKKNEVENAIRNKLQCILSFNVPKDIPIVMDANMKNLNVVYISAGQTGWVLEIKPKELIRMMRKVGYKMVDVEIEYVFEETKNIVIQRLQKQNK